MVNCEVISFPFTINYSLFIICFRFVEINLKLGQLTSFRVKNEREIPNNIHLPSKFEGISPRTLVEMTYELGNPRQHSLIIKVRGDFSSHARRNDMGM